MMKKIPLLLLMLMGLAPCAFADWTLLNDQSSLQYISIKDAHIGEINRFKNLSGSVSEAGEVSLTIDLASVETGIPIRDERMQAMLFDVGQFAQAKISGMLDLTRATQPELGETYTDTIKLTLSLHGIEKELNSRVQVTQLAGNKISVVALEPVLMNAADYKLAEAVEALREIAKLPSISLLVPVTYSLVFQPSAQ